MNIDLGKNINTRDLETKIQEFWDANDFWENDVNSDKKSFCVMMPPPNVTGSLHMGHGMPCVLEDITCRYKRMDGFDVLWQPKITFAGFLPEDNKKKLSEKELSEQRIKKIDKQIAPLKGQTFKDCDAVEKQAKTLISKDMKKYFTCKCTDWDDEMNATDGKFSYNCSDGYLQTGVMGTLTKSDKKQSIKESLERVLENGAFHDCSEINKMVKETQKSDMKYLKDCKCSVDGKKFTYECTNPDLILIHITGELTDSEKMSDTEELDEEDSGDEEEGFDEEKNVEEQNKGLKEDVDAIMNAFNKAIKRLTNK